MKILIVDDSNFIRRMIEMTLSKMSDSITFFTAPNPIEGLKIFEKEKPTLVITDLLMPKMNGQNFIKVLHELYNFNNIIVVTANLQNATKEYLLDQGIKYIVNKPIDDTSGSDLVKYATEVLKND